MKEAILSMAEAIRETETKLNSLPPISEQKKMLEEYLLLSRPGRLKVGDFIKRNTYGETRYKFPKEGQIARVLEIFDSPQNDGEDRSRVTGRIIIVDNYSHGCTTVNYTVDLALYEPIPEPQDEEAKAA